MESLRASDDFRSLLSTFNAEGVKYLVVGAFALAHYGRPRYTKDLDVWIDPEPSNASRVYRALAIFGAPMDDLRPEDFSDEDLVFQIGVEPIRVDVLTAISGVAFQEAWARRESALYADIPVQLISRDDYIINKRASGRPSDLRDLEALDEDTR
jgi:hypothetical protein